MYLLVYIDTRRMVLTLGVHVVGYGNEQELHEDISEDTVVEHLA